MAPVDSSFDLYTYLSSLTLAEREAFARGESQVAKRDANITEANDIENIRDRIAEWFPELSTVGAADSMKFEIRDAVPIMTSPPNYSGAVDPVNVNMKAIQAIFAIIGAAMVLGSIWFFFWAKNGGFKWRKNDWEEYKSTVLRRKGPNGTTLSNASKSTRLGGGSVVRDGYSDRDTATSYADETSTVYTGTMTELSSSTAPIIKEKQGTSYTGDRRSRRKHSRRHENAKERKQREMKEAEFEGAHDADVRAYMKEKPARVGGINSAGDTLHYGTDYTDTESSVGYTQSHDSRPPAPPRHTAAMTEPSVRQPSMSQTPRHHSRAAQSPTYAAPPPEPTTRKSAPYTIRSVQPTTSSQGTRSYHHPLPEARGQNTGGFRRGGSSLDED